LHSISASQKELIQCFDYSVLKGEILIRNRMEGDSIYISKVGKKKLKKYFIDEKIPRNIREQVPLVLVNNEVIWIVGYRIDERYKAVGKTKKVLKLSFDWDQNFI